MRVFGLEKVLILGSSGLVGRALIGELKIGFDLYGTYSSRGTTLPENKQFQLDIQQIDKLKELLRFIKPDLVNLVTTFPTLLVTIDDYCKTFIIFIYGVYKFLL